LRTVAAVPPGMAWSDAGAVPEAFITAHDALRQARARPGDAVLVHAVGSGVGLAAVQLARAFAMTPYGTARTAAKIDRARELGLADGVVPDAELRLIAERAREWTGGRGVDVALDLAGGPYLAATVQAMAPRGRIVLIGLVAGARADVDLGRLLRQRLTIVGTVLRARPLEERIATTRAFAAEVVPSLAAGAVRPVVDARFELAELARAHERLESNATFGKVVIDVG
jgi:NADPH:quinone reductase-like Zn-dependent oxidoreductase